MGDKRNCPACGSYSSSVLIGMAEDGRCPFCGLSVEVADEIERIRELRADKKLRERLETLLKELDAWRRRARRAERTLSSIRGSVEHYDQRQASIDRQETLST